MSARKRRQRGTDEAISRPRRDPAPRSGPRQPSARTAAVVVFLLALGLRLAYFLSIRDAYFFRFLQTNPQRYDTWARLIVSGHAPLPPFEQSPGYAYFLALLYATVGAGGGTVAVVQGLLDAGTCALVGAATRHWFGARAGLVAGLLAAFYGPFIYFSAEILPATLFLFLAVAAVYAAARGAWLGAGCAWAVALVVRSETLLACPLVCLEAWKRGAKNALLRAALPPALAVAVLVAVNAGFAYRFVALTTSGGANLWLGNNPYADGVSPFVSGPLQTVAAEVRAEAGGDAADVDRLFRRRALNFWLSSPGRAARLAWKKFLWTLNNRELPNTGDIEWQVDQSRLFRRPWFPLGFGTILPLALGGIALSGRVRDASRVLGALWVIGFGTTVLFFTNARFRLVLVPGLLPFAAALLAGGAELVRAAKARGREAVRVAAAIVVGAIVAWGNFGGVGAYRIAEIDVNTGILAREAGDLDTAVRYLRSGLAAAPADGIAWVHLALALEQAGDVSAAGRVYLDGLERIPGDAELRRRATRFAQAHGLPADFADRYLREPPGPGREVRAADLLRPLTRQAP